MGAENIPLLRMLWFLPPLAVLLLVGWRMKLGLNKNTIISTVRMIVQLAFVGLYLQYLFDLDNAWVNVAYSLLMVGVAAYTGTGNSGLDARRFVPLLFATLAVPHLCMIVFFNLLVVGLPDPFTAAYLIPLGGMLLGNCMRANIIALERFFGSLHSNERQYLFRLSMGATRREALASFLREAVRASAGPTLANMATLGLVALPGMMTGQMLGGSSPAVAIKYQIAIMLGIFIVQYASVLITLEVSARRGFDAYDMLRPDVFAHKKQARP